MDIKQLKSTMKLAELRAKTNPSDDNVAILKAATEAYELALDPEKKTAGPSHEDEADHKPKPEAPKPAAAPKVTAAKPASQKPAGTEKVETSAPATQSAQPEPSTQQGQEQQPVTETTPQPANQAETPA